MEWQEQKPGCTGLRSELSNSEYSNRVWDARATGLMGHIGTDTAAQQGRLGAGVFLHSFA